MPNPRFGWQTFSRLLISLLVVLIPLAVIAYFYFGQKRDYHVSRNFRTLNAAGRHLGAHLETLGNVLGNASIKMSEREILEEVVGTESNGSGLGDLLESEAVVDALVEALEFERKLEDACEEIEKNYTSARKVFGREAREFSYDREELQAGYESGGSSLDNVTSTVISWIDDDTSEMPVELAKEVRLAAELWNVNEVRIDRHKAVKDLATSLEYALRFERWLLRRGGSRELSDYSWEEVAKNQTAVLGVFGEEALKNSYDREDVRSQYMKNDDFLSSLNIPEIVKDRIKIWLAQHDAVRNLMTSLKSALDSAALSEDFWTRVRNALPQSEPLKRESMISEYLAKNKELEKPQSSELRRLGRNPIYRNIEITSSPKECMSTRDSARLRVNSSEASVSLIVCRQKAQAKLPLADLMLNMDVETSNFDLLIVAKGDGEIFYSSAYRDPDRPHSIFTEFMDLAPFFQQIRSEIKTDSSQGATQKDENSQTILPLVSVTRKAEIAGDTYRLFLQPFRPPFSVILPVSQTSEQEKKFRTDDEPIWYLGGIIRESDFQVKYITVPLTVAGLATLGLILGILSWPYLKTFFISAGEKLRTFDVFFLVTSLVFGSGLVTILMLNTLNYYNMRSQFDKTAKKIGKEMRERFRIELGDALGALHSAPRIMDDKDVPPPLSDKLAFNNPDNLEWKLLPDRYPLLESMFFVTDDGIISPDVWINYRLEKRDSFLNISKRNYFLRAKNRDGLWKIEYDQKKEEEQSFAFSIQRVRSNTDGVKSSI